LPLDPIVRSRFNRQRAYRPADGNEEYFRSFRIDYHGGERYPHLERVEGKPDVLGEIAKMRAPAVTAGTD